MISIGGAVSDNYALSYTNGTLTVGKADLVLVADDQSKVYGEDAPELTFHAVGLLGSDTKASALSTAPVLTTAGKFAPAGTHVISIGGAVSDNYALSYTNGTLTVGKADLVLVADDQSKVYGEDAPELTFHAVGLLGSDTKASALSTAPVLTTAGKFAPAGTHVISIGGAVSDNYALSYTNGTLTVGKADLVLVADDQSKVYGEDAPELTFHAVGLLGSDTKASALSTAPVLTTAGKFAPAGTHVISIGGAVSDNYALSYTNGTLTVGKADLVLVADDKSKVYGEDAPELTFHAVGLLGSDTKASALSTAPVLTTAGKFAPAGTHVISISGAVSDNYTLSYTNGTLTVGKADLVLVADDKSKVYGEDAPELTFHAVGLLGSDTKASALSTAPVLTTAGKFRRRAPM